MRVDAHQHFWALDRGDYGWLTPDKGPIYRDFGPEDLAPHLHRNGIGGTVIVQAAPTVAETHYMLGISDAQASVLGVVGWVDFEAVSAPAQIATLAAHPKLVGLRPMIQDIPDPEWMLQDKLHPAFDALEAEGLVFDALTLPPHLRHLLTLLTACPGLKSVIDHGSKPLIAEGVFEPWASDMAALAANTSAFVKLSGLVTEAGEDWTVDKLRPYTDHLLDCFGPARMIWGSDWPVCTLASSYDRWCEATDALLADVSDADRDAILGHNALAFYGLETPA